MFNLYRFLRRKHCPYQQFAKYVFCGGVSVGIDQLVFYILAWLILPCLRATDPVVRFLEFAGFDVVAATGDELRRNYWIIKVACFLVSNAVVYLLNVLFVFRGGRHARTLEIAMFFGFSLFQFFYIWLGGVLITRFGWEVTYANVSMVTLGVITNYFARKKIVFKG